MKRNFYMAILSIAVLLLGCTDSENELVTDDYSNGKTTKGMVSPSLGKESSSNPNLYYYWDDWTKVNNIFLNREGEVDPPWYTNFGNSMRIPENIRIDVKKEDGWIMLGHTLERLNLAEPNYMIFYNKRTGILKGFYFSDAAEQNQNVKWVLSTSQPSSLLPANERFSNLSSQGQTYAITSNIVIPNVISSEGPLNQGWNCFTFELPYGTLNQNPIISITGYSINRYELTGTGTFSGQVVVPTTVTSNSLDSWKSFLNMTSSFTGATSTFANLFKKPSTKTSSELLNGHNKSTKSIIGTIGIINSAVSIASSLLGGASFFTSKKETVIQRYDFSGNIKLTGEVVGKFDGLIKSIDNINLGLLNNNEVLGVWGLKELPKITVKKYAFVNSFSVPVDTERYDVERSLYIKPEVKKESIIINPALLPLIKDYKVTVGDVISASSSDKKIRGLKYEQIQNDWYSANTDKGSLKLQTKILPGGYMYLRDTRYVDFYMSFLDTFPEMYVSVLVEIEYNDGSVLSSSRVFKVNGSIYDNKSDITRSTPRYTQNIFVNYLFIGEDRFSL